MPAGLRGETDSADLTLQRIGGPAPKQEPAAAKESLMLSVEASPEFTWMLISRPFSKFPQRGAAPGAAPPVWSQRGDSECFGVSRHLRWGPGGPDAGPALASAASP